MSKFRNSYEALRHFDTIWDEYEDAVSSSKLKIQYGTDALKQIYRLYIFNINAIMLNISKGADLL
jgi:hypothetical protein